VPRLLGGLTAAAALGLTIPLFAGMSTAAAKTATFRPVSDTYVSQAHPGKRYGRSPRLRVDGRPLQRAYLRFNVKLPRGAVIRRASLRLFTRSRRGSKGYYVSPISRRRWTEPATVYRSAPALRRRLIGRARGWKRPGWKRAPLSARALKRGRNSFAVATTSRLAKVFGSRQSRHRPRLVIAYDVGGAGGRLPRPGDPLPIDPLPIGPCPSFAPSVKMGNLDFSAAEELSGLAASRRNPGVLWSHNDSGDTERVFAMDSTAQLIGTHTVSANSQQDWEDIAVGPGPNPGTSYLYIGSIGGNNGRHDLHVYRAPEPQVTAGAAPYTVPLSSAVKLRMHYPGSEEHNSETLLVDPLTSDIYVVTKTYSGQARVYRYPAAQQNPATDYALQFVTTLDIPTGALTAGDISPNGSEIAIKGYNESYIWRRASGASIAQALQTTACPIPHGNGEALAFSANGNSYYTITEGSSVPLYNFARLTN